MDGNWNGQALVEGTRQPELSKHRILRVNTSDIAGPTPLPGDASAFANSSPNTLAGSSSGGPHFILSSNTPDNSHTYGFEFFLLTDLSIPGEFAVPAAGGFTVTVWVLIGNAEVPGGGIAAVDQWVRLEPQTGVGFNEMWHTFDVNACAIRFEFGNIASEGSIIIGLCEL